MIEAAAVDTHALIWYASGQERKLGSQSRRLFGQVDRGLASLYVPTIALVELAEAENLGRVELEGRFAAWVRRLFRDLPFIPVELSVDIVLEAASLPATLERGDRLLAATALHLGCPLITRDRDIEKLTGVKVIW